jgi:hypothetical protein
MTKSRVSHSLNKEESKGTTYHNNSFNLFNLILTNVLSALFENIKNNFECLTYSFKTKFCFFNSLNNPFSFFW